MQVPSPHLADEVLRLRVGEVVALVNLLRVGLALIVALVELLGLAPHPSRLLGCTAVGGDEDGRGRVDIDRRRALLQVSLI